MIDLGMTTLLIGAGFGAASTAATVVTIHTMRVMNRAFRARAGNPPTPKTSMNIPKPILKPETRATGLKPLAPIVLQPLMETEEGLVVPFMSDEEFNNRPSYMQKLMDLAMGLKPESVENNLE